MLQQLINHNLDLSRLQEAGFKLEVKGGHLLAHHIPYVNTNKDVKYGILVCVLTFATATKLGKPQDHTIYFCGETPCEKEGTPYNAIINNSNTVTLADGIVVNHYFSSKPPSGNYSNYYDKIRTYSEILCSQAKYINDSVTYKPLKNNETHGNISI